MTERGEIHPSEFFGLERLSYIFDSYNKTSCSLLSRTALRESVVRRILIPEFAKVPKNDLRHYCKYCYFPWKEGKYSMKVLPKNIPGKRISKLLKKKKTHPEKLSKYEKNLIQYVQQDQGNKLVLTCSFCNKKTIKPMFKDKNLIKCTFEEPQEKLNEKKKKKKKKKDIFAGLRKDVLLKSNSELRSKHFLSVNKKENYKNEISKKTLKGGNVQTYKNNQETSFHENRNKQKSTFFHKQEEKLRLENQKKKENAKQNQQLRKMLNSQVNKKTKSNLTDFKNFLRDFAKPV